MTALFRVVQAASRISLVCNAEFNLLGKIEAGGTSYAIMPRPLAEAIRDLYAMLQPALATEYAEGKRDGHNLLMRLASGDLAPNEYMDKSS